MRASSHSHGDGAVWLHLGDVDLLAVAEFLVRVCVWACVRASVAEGQWQCGSRRGFVRLSALFKTYVSSVTYRCASSMLALM